MSLIPPFARERILLPQQPARLEPRPFPLAACLAPVGGALLIWAITRSPFALLFAVFGPLVAVASTLDAAWQSRRRRRREAGRFEEEIVGVENRVDELKSSRHAALVAAHPSAAAIACSARRDPERWRAPFAAARLVLGRGSLPSGIAVEGDAAGDRADGLRASAAALDNAPIVADPSLGIGVVGPPALAEAVARGLLLQLAAAGSPSLIAFDLVGESTAVDRWRWLSALPHEIRIPRETGATHRATGITALLVSSSGVLLVAVAAAAGSLPNDCRVVIEVTSAGLSRITRHPGDLSGQFLSPEFVSHEQARKTALFLADAARESGIAAPGGSRQVSFSELSAVSADITLPYRRLAATFCTTDGDPVTVDLVAEGPHAIVGGTTGSGKSELLVSWLLALARRYPPAIATFLLVDFKGGASFLPLAELPHVVGIVTDLDDRRAERAILSLRAELRFRERMLADRSARSIDELEPGLLARLVIVVDEFAALVVEHPELHGLFADLASRGRSLGIHLILCTQRPAGVLRDAVFANSAIRVSLRVHSAEDSRAVIGTSIAAELPSDRPGTGYLAIGGAAPVRVSIAAATADDAARVSRTWPVTTAPRRPWCEDLPSAIALETLPPADAQSGLPIGLIDRPELQSQETATWQPSTDGNVLVLGGRASGKSDFLAGLATRMGCPVLSDDPEAAWDALGRDSRGDRTAILVDDVDSLLARLPDDYRQVVIDRLAALLRDGSHSGTPVVLSARRITAPLQALAALCDERLVLGLASRQDHVLAGGDAALFRREAPAGAGIWRDARIQLARVEGELPARLPALLPTRLSATGTTVVVAARPEEATRRFSARFGESVIRLGVGLGADAGDGAVRGAALQIGEPPAGAFLVSDVEGWQSRWSQFSALRHGADLVFDGCGVPEFRTLTGIRELPPLLAVAASSAGDRRGWLLSPDGTVSRVILPG